MNRMRLINEMRRTVRRVTVRCTVTTPDGKTEHKDVMVQANKLNKLWGNALTGKNLYDLNKKGRTETVDWTGAKFVYEVLPEQVEEKKDEVIS